MADQVERHREQLREAGLRATRARLDVLDLLQRSAGPMSHPDVAAALSAATHDRATLFRNLNDLAAAGLLRRFDAGDHVWRFELITAEDGPPHPHFFCTDCGDVQCLEPLEVRMAGKGPQSVTAGRFEVQLRGLCDACT